VVVDGAAVDADLVVVAAGRGAHLAARYRRQPGPRER
jgi:hypothetical protein